MPADLQRPDAAKAGGRQLAAPAYNHWQKLRSPWLIASVAALGCGMLLWIYLLQRLPLSMAYPMLSINLVLVLVGSRLFFHEQISYHNWLGWEPS